MSWPPVVEKWTCNTCLKQVETKVQLYAGTRVWACPPSGWLFCFFADKFVCSIDCAKKAD